MLHQPRFRDAHGYSRFWAMVLILFVAAVVLGVKTFGPMASTIMSLRQSLKVLGNRLVVDSPTLAESAIRELIDKTYANTGVNLTRSDVNVERAGEGGVRLGMHVLLPYKLPWEPAPRFYETNITTEVQRLSGY